MTGLIIFVAIAGIIILCGVIAHRLEKTRTETLRTVIVPQLGLQFTPTDETGIRTAFDGFKLFSYGQSQKISNIGYGRMDDVEVIVFEYQYTTGGGKNKVTHHQTVGFFQCDALNLPEFIARPEGMFDKIGQVFGYQDIDLPMHPEFSRKYILRGNDEAGIRDFFKMDVARFFESNPGLSVETKSDRFILYRPAKRLKPEQWREWLDKGLSACAVLRGR